MRNKGDDLEQRILAVAVRPMTYPEIADCLGMYDDPEYTLARTLARKELAERV